MRKMHPEDREGLRAFLFLIACIILCAVAVWAVFQISEGLQGLNKTDTTFRCRPGETYTTAECP